MDYRAAGVWIHVGWPNSCWRPAFEYEWRLVDPAEVDTVSLDLEVEALAGL
jgi:hypothetical protein